MDDGTLQFYRDNVQAYADWAAAEDAKEAALHWGACENLSTPEILLPLRDIARAAGVPRVPVGRADG